MALNCPFGAVFNDDPEARPFVGKVPLEALSSKIALNCPFGAVFNDDPEARPEPRRTLTLTQPLHNHYTTLDQNRLLRCPLPKSRAGWAGCTFSTEGFNSWPKKAFEMYFSLTGREKNTFRTDFWHFCDALCQKLNC